MITREEYRTYMRLKGKINCQDGSTQTDLDEITFPQQQQQPLIILQGLPFQNLRIPLGKDYEEDSDYEDDEEDETEQSDSGSDDDSCDHSVKKRKRQNIQYYPEEKAYYKKLNKKQKTEIDAMEHKINDINFVKIPLRFRVLESDMDMRLKAIAINKIEQLNSIEPSSSEYMKMQNWIENLCKLPIGKYKKLPIDFSKSVDEITSFLDTTKVNLDKKVFGHTDAKNQIIRLLAKWIANPESKGLVIGIEGAMGVGKTTLCNGICESLGLPFGFVQLGGISDGSYLVGHSYTYEGSRWGRLAEILMRVGCMNPVLYFDELDKISNTRHGEEIVNILIHLTDGSQNDKFHDKYFSDIEMDLSKCLIVFSYNNAELINPILRDRMITIKTDGYKHKDKMKISKDYMLPIILKEFSIAKEDLIIPDDVLSYVINMTETEEGVRNLKRSLEEIVSQINLHRLLKKEIIDKKPLQFPLELTRDIVDKFVQRKKDTNTSLPMMYI